MTTMSPAGGPPLPTVRIAWMLRGADLALVLVLHQAFYLVRMGHAIDAGNGADVARLAVFSTVLLACVWLFDGWRLHPRGQVWRLPFRFAGGVASAAIAIGLGVYLLGPELIGDQYGVFGRIVVGSTLVSYAFAGMAVRWSLMRRLNARSGGLRWLLITTAEDEDVRGLESDFARHADHLGALEVQGMGAAADPSVAADRLRQGWSGILLHGQLPDEVLRAAMHARLAGCPVLDLADFYEQYWQRVPVRNLDPRWFALSDGFGLLHSPWYARAKRLSDIVLAALVLIASSWLMVLTAIAVKLDSRGPVLYRQRRTGQGGREFVIAKFRSMRTDAEAGGARWAAKDDPRVTRLGRLLRKSRIDELPQLWNVLVGDMSMIGPRPERPEFNQDLERRIPWYDLRHLVKPGLSGWAQVNYPYGASVEDAQRKLEYDLFYIKNQSFPLDLVIVVRTVRVVLFGFGGR